MTTIITLNHAPVARPALLRCNLFFAPGERPRMRPVNIGGYAAAPYEETFWPDGSVRIMETRWWMMVPPGVSEHAVDGGELLRDIHLSTLGVTPMSLPLAAVNEGFAMGGEPCVWEWEMQREDGLSWNAIGYARTPNGMWAELHAEGIHGAPFIRFAWHYGWNDRSPEVHKWQRTCWIRVTGLQLGIWDSAQKVLVDLANDGVSVCSDEDWNDGQSQIVRGVLMLPDADPIWHEELNGPCIAFQKDALSTGAFGLVGRVPTAGLPAVSSEAAQAWAESELSKRPQGDPWQAPTWHSTEPGQTGDRRAFGLIGPAAALFGNAPQALELARFSGDQEACRPIWFRSAVRNRFLTNAESQDVAWWCERPHMWGKDKLDKTETPNMYVTGARSARGERWWGMDRQHNEDMSAIGYLMLTGDPVSKHLAAQRVERLLGELRTDTGNATIDSTDSGRGARALAMLAHYSEVFPKREDIIGAIRKRVDLYWRTWEPQRLLPVCSQQYYGPSDQSGGLPIDHHRPWEDAVAAVVMMKCYLVTGDVRAWQMAVAWGWNIAQHGFVKQPDGRWQVGVAIAWNDGQPLTEEQKRNPTLFKLPYQADYRPWCFGALAIAWNGTSAIGDQTARRALLADILADLLRDPPSDTDARMERQEWLAIELLAPTGGHPLPAPVQ